MAEHHEGLLDLDRVLTDVGGPAAENSPGSIGSAARYAPQRISSTLSPIHSHGLVSAGSGMASRSWAAGRASARAGQRLGQGSGQCHIGRLGRRPVHHRDAHAHKHPRWGSPENSSMQPAGTSEAGATGDWSPSQPASMSSAIAKTQRHTRCERSSALPPPKVFRLVEGVGFSPIRDPGCLASTRWRQPTLLTPSLHPGAAPHASRSIAPPIDSGNDWLDGSAEWADVGTSLAVHRPGAQGPRAVLS